MQRKSGWIAGLGSVQQISTLALVLLCSGCSIVPGMRNEIDRGSVSSPDVDIIELTPEVVVGEALLEGTAPRFDDVSALRTTQAEDQAGYRLGPGDVIRVVVWEHPELNNPSGQAQGDAASSGRLVEPDGTVYFPYVGKIKAAGMTPSDLRAEISKSLTRIIREPQVDVRVTEFRSQRVYVTGEVTTPGPMFLNDSPIGALDAIASKGGFTELSNRNRILLTRSGVTTSLGVGDSTRPDPRTSIHLKDGDQLHIPDIADDKIFLLGEFATQKTILQGRSTISLAEALTEGGGLERAGSNAKAVFIFRRKAELAPSRQQGLALAAGLSSGATPAPAVSLEDQRSNLLPKVYALDMTRAESLLLAERFPLKPRDVVYVASTDFSKYNRIIGQLLPTITAYFQLDRLINQ